MFLKVAVFWIAAALFLVAQDQKSHDITFQGQKIFKKHFRKKCRFSGVRFARHHTKSEWEQIWKEKRFDQEAKQICPRLQIDQIRQEWWLPIYEFSKAYAKGESVPEC